MFCLIIIPQFEGKVNIIYQNNSGITPILVLIIYNISLPFSIYLLGFNIRNNLYWFFYTK